MNSDSELLRRYVEERSEAAFTTIVQRHIGLVYSVALRRVGGDTHLAEDVAQRVFGDLARKAASLSDRATLAGWLYVSAHRASAATVRGEQRRKAREAEAHLMETTLTDSTPEADWAQLRPVIDDAIVSLKEEEREAIALRYFENRSFAEVGTTLRVTEEAARKRVARAVDKLRALLAHRGVTSTVTAVGVALTAVGVASAPLGLSAKIAGHALANAGAVSGGSIASSLFKVALPTAAVVVIGGLLINTQRGTNGRLRAELAQLSSESTAIAALRAENSRIARAIADAQATSLPRMERAIPRATLASAPLAPRPVSAQVSVSPEGTLSWNHEPVNLRDFLKRLHTLQAAADPEARIVINGAGAEFPALNYVIDEVRKAQIGHVTIESDAKPDPKFGGSWF
ncbi:MAG: hypothetical protein RLZZ15_1733 [Verrucomicrobiota bacterium]|jgi:RNA polymerase sigma factor (sigma-70 family)